jgi:hypothetical protein
MSVAPEAVRGELVAAAPRKRSALTTTTPADLLRLAVEQGADLDRLEKLMDLQTRYEADQARKAYVAAMAAFKAEPLSIDKDKHVRYVKKDGSVTEYDHASIGNVVTRICAELGKHGFSHRWDTKQIDGKVTVTCIITHELGHSESTQLFASPDDSGGKNGIQSIASTVTYLQRYTLLAATGLATSDQEDDDGRGAGDAVPMYLAAEYADWKSKIDDCVTPDDFAATWKEMSPGVRKVMADYVKQKKAEVLP